LLVAPPATALRLTARPALGVAISVALSVAVVWIGETIAFYTPYPIGFWVTTLAFAAYLLAAGYRLLADRQSRRTPDAALVRIAA
jgi:zinc/manganese transport system permease protein